MTGPSHSRLPGRLGAISAWVGAAFSRAQGEPAARGQGQGSLPLFLLPAPGTPGRRRWRYVVAFAVVAAAALVRLGFLQVLGTRATYVTFYPAVMLAALYGGLSAGLLATILSAGLAAYFWIEPAGLAIQDPADWLALVIFLVGGTMISAVTEAMHRAQARAREAEIQAGLAAAGRREAEVLRESEARREVAEAVEAERRRLFDVLETLPVMVCLLTADHHVAFANRTFREKFGEDEGRHCFEYRFGKPEPCAFCESYEVLKTGNPHRWEVASPDGQSLIDVYDFPFTDIDGSPMILETDIDITEQRRAERLIKAERKRLENVLEMMPAYAVLLTPDYHVAYANRTFRDWFGDDHGQKCYEFLFHRKEPCETCETYTVLRTGKSHFWEWTGPNGRNYDIYDYPFTDTDGSPLIMEIGVDVTAHRQAQTALQSASLYSRSLLEASRDPLVTISPEGKITDVNEATIEVTGIARDQLVGTDFSSYFTEPEKAREGYQQVFAQGFVTDYPLTIHHQDGRLTDVLYNASVYKDTHGNVLGVFAAARDITERKRVEAELAKHREHLEELVLQRTEDLARSNRDLEQFAYVASHDLQEPLRAVAGFVALLQQRYQGKLDEKADGYISLAVDGAARMQTLIGDLLSYSRVGTKGKAMEPTDTRRSLQDALTNLHTSIGESGAVIQVDPLPTVQADAIQLTQLYQNLIANAVKFRSDRPPEIQIGARREQEAWRFWVRDNGIGIEPQYAERIFMIFQRLHTRKTYPGTGIGLAICKRIVERHGGSIWVESQPGQGSTFYFTLPDKGERL